MKVQLNNEVGHYIKAEVQISPIEDYDQLFHLPFIGWCHILLNGIHHILNCQTYQLIPCKDYSQAQDWCYKFTCKHLMI